MLTYYCPNCWTAISEGQQTCPNCGYVLGEFDNLPFEDKLLAALNHSVQERRIIAAQILGNRGSQRAVPVFQKIIASDEEDYFFLRAVLLALSKIDHPDRLSILQEANRHSSDLVRSLAQELITQIQQNDQADWWDSHTE